MKRMWLWANLALMGTFLMAGGDVYPSHAANSTSNSSDTQSISNASCKNDKVFIEPETNLMWQDEQYTDREDGAYKREFSFEKAGKYKHALSYCRNLDYAGYNDWRLPTSEELTHVHYEEFNPFAHYRASDYWTSTPADALRYYVVFTADAHPYKRSPNESNYIRCVRCTGDNQSRPGSINIR